MKKIIILLLLLFFLVFDIFSFNVSEGTGNFKNSNLENTIIIIGLFLLAGWIITYMKKQSEKKKGYAYQQEKVIDYKVINKKDK